MPTLDEVFVVLEHDFDVGSVIGTHYGGVLVDSATVWPVGDASDAENASDFEEVGHLQGRIRRNKRHAVHGVSLLPVHKPG